MYWIHFDTKKSLQKMFRKIQVWCNMFNTSYNYMDIGAIYNTSRCVCSIHYFQILPTPLVATLFVTFYCHFNHMCAADTKWSVQHLFYIFFVVEKVHRVWNHVVAQVHYIIGRGKADNNVTRAAIMWRCVLQTWTI